MNEIFEVLLPGMMYFWVQFVGQGPMQEVLQEKETHTLARILAAPVTVSQYVLAKLVRCFLLCFVIQMLLLLLTSLLFGIHWGNALPLSITVAASALSMTGFLGFIYSLAKTKEQANVITPIAIMVFAMVGGCMFPFNQLPPFMQAVGQFTPNRWAVVALQHVAKDKPLMELLLRLAMLAGFGLFGSLASFALFQRQIIRGGGR
jgi:ABC-2 type transport system permease protein